MSLPNEPATPDCPVCGKRISTKKDGTLRSHDGHTLQSGSLRFRQHCPGSGADPGYYRQEWRL